MSQSEIIKTEVREKVRDTGTGKILERMILPAIAAGGYSYKTQCHIGERFGGGKHIIDVVAVQADWKEILISLKWQQVGGTAEQKVPFEAICLTEAVLNSSGRYSKAYLVLGGEGWKLRDFFTNGGLHKHLTHSDFVTILTLESFLAAAMKGNL
jgi:hypothetical protein